MLSECRFGGPLSVLSIASIARMVKRLQASLRPVPPGRPGASLPLIFEHITTGPKVVTAVSRIVVHASVPLLRALPKGRCIRLAY